ncbi:MAG TPA: biotin--[acetyl-CoA-carboxylase] ligase [Candidatus Acidoferrales bacterium]|nr:biotin--[acetyl-CoA-carboxylase] ligase [Candidatus Acidoferrales bacterium]
MHLESVTSTQEVARGLPLGSVVVADHQTAGRGRGDRVWETPPGTALLASFVVPPQPLLSLACGVAAAEACGARVRLKWPNDLLLGGRKVGGILVEAGPRKAVVGIGINLSWAPPGAARLGQDRDRLLTRLRAALERWCSAPAEEVLAAWRRRSDTLGRQVRVWLPSGVIEGRAEDVDQSGALIVDGQPVSVGDVIHVRPGRRARPAAAGSRPSGRAAPRRRSDRRGSAPR